MGNISPVVFPFKNWELITASGKEGVILLLDSKSLGARIIAPPYIAVRNLPTMRST